MMTTPTRAPSRSDVDAWTAGSTGHAASVSWPPGLRPSWWQWPTVLSLDAPVITVVWLALVARSLEIELALPATVVLGTSVWLGYAADRSIEGWRLPRHDVRTPRHFFYQRWRRAVAGVWLAAFVSNVALATASLPVAQLVAGWVLTTAVAVYLLSHQLVHRERRWRLPKEICIAGLLTAGCAVFLVGKAPVTAMFLPLALFAAVCFVNCALISSWERDVDRAHRQSSLALSRHARLIPWTPWILAAAAAALAVLGGTETRAVASCAAASAFLMAAIDHFEPRLGWRAARVLADSALLTPLVVLGVLAA